MFLVKKEFGEVSEIWKCQKATNAESTLYHWISIPFGLSKATGIGIVSGFTFDLRVYASKVFRLNMHS